MLVRSCMQVTTSMFTMLLYVGFVVPDGRVKPVLPEVHSVDSSSSFYYASSHGAVSWNWSCLSQ